MEYRVVRSDDYLAHYGVLGMHWGVRRYQKYGEGGYEPKDETKKHRMSSKTKKVLIAAGAVAVTAGLAAYGVHKVKKLNSKGASSAIGVLKTAGKVSVSDIPKVNHVDVPRVNPARTAVNRIDVPRVNPARTVVNRVDVPTIPKSPKKLSDFEFDAVRRIDAAGKATDVMVPKYKEGYARAFASEMSKSATKYGLNEQKQYQYYYDYIKRKLDQM